MILQTKCMYCGKTIYVSVPDKSVNIDTCSCNDCIPENSPARNGIEESLYVEHPVAYKLRKGREKILKMKDGGDKMQDPVEHLEEFYQHGYVSKFEPVAVDVVVRVDKEMLGWLDMKKFPDNSQELIDAIREAVYLAHARA